MKVLALTVFLVLAGCRDREVVGSAPIEYRFDHPVSDAVVVRAIAILQTRLGTLAGIVKQHGDSILIDAGTDLRLSGLEARLRPPPVALRIEDSESPYLEKLVKHVRSDSVAAALKLEAVTDLGMGEARPIDRFVKATDDYRHVNVAWADKHHCDAKREPGRGVFCAVAAEELLSAYVHGDKELFVDALDAELAPPDGTELAIVPLLDGVWRTRLFERTPIPVDSATIAAADPQPGFVAVTLTAAGASAIGARATGKRVVLTTLNGAYPGTLAGSTLRFETVDPDAVYALALATLPAKLVLVSATR